MASQSLKHLNVMLVDESIEHSSVFQDVLLSCGYEVVSRVCINEDVVDAVTKQSPDVVVVDVELPCNHLLGLS